MIHPSLWIVTINNIYCYRVRSTGGEDPYRWRCTRRATTSCPRWPRSGTWDSVVHRWWPSTSRSTCTSGRDTCPSRYRTRTTTSTRWWPTVRHRRRGRTQLPRTRTRRSCCTRWTLAGTWPASRPPPTTCCRPTSSFTQARASSRGSWTWSGDKTRRSGARSQWCSRYRYSSWRPTWNCRPTKKNWWVKYYFFVFYQSITVHGISSGHSTWLKMILQIII